MSTGRGSGAGAPAGSGHADVLAQWARWLGDVSDRLFDIDQRASIDGTDAVRLDVAAAFVCRTAIVARIESLQGGANDDAAAAAGRPVLDADGAPVADNLATAATLLVAILDRVDATLAGVEATRVATARDRAAAEADVDAAARLSDELGEQSGHVAELRARLAATRTDPRGVPDVAAELAEVRAALVASASARDGLLARWPAVSDQASRLRTRETEVRALVAMCREKVRPLPKLAVPSVAALGEPASLEHFSSMPWPAARAVMQPYVERLDRVSAALEQVADRHREVLERRDELRGLLHAFRAKAGAHGLAESAELEPAFHEAESVLWSAPCDVDRAAELVAAYTAAVNRAIDDLSIDKPAIDKLKGNP